MAEYDVVSLDDVDPDKIVRIPAFRVAPGVLAWTPDNIEDDAPNLPAVVLQLRRPEAPDEDAITYVMAPHSALQLGILIIDAGRVAHDMDTRGGEHAD